MSHLKERKEKICLNCKADLYGRYCHVCGQQNLEPKETVWHLVEHFFNDITHFDGSFFSTVKYLLRKPGFLSTEYMAGRRASYLNPIRMYVFTSAIFFIILFSLQSPDKIVKVKETPEVGKGLSALAKDSAKLEKNLANEKDEDNQGSSNFFDMQKDQYKSVAAYDSAQRRLPDSLRNGWFARILKRRLIAIGIEYHQDKKSWKQHFAENFLHSFPKILFFSLPFFALILNMLYFRHKQYFYVDHGIFTIHLYIANFILILIMVLLNKLSDLINVEWIQVIIGILNFLIWLYMLIYLYKAMRGFYKQGRFKTFVKYFLTCCMALVVNMILLMIFLILSAITIH